MREPRDLTAYCSADEAATGLEQLAREIRAHAADRPLAKWYMTLRFWNPAWKADFKGDHMVTGASFSNKKPGEPDAD